MDGMKDSIRQDFLNVISEFKAYLCRNKPNPCIRVSDTSASLMDQWASVQPDPPLFFFQGPETPSVFIIDSQGDFFDGESGELLTRILTAMNLSRDTVGICNAGDMDAVKRKIRQAAPDVIITLGTLAGQTLLDLALPLEQFRGKFHRFEGIKVMPTFHPSRLLTQPELKRAVWEDMKQVMQVTGLAHGS